MFSIKHLIITLLSKGGKDTHKHQLLNQHQRYQHQRYQIKNLQAEINKGKRKTQRPQTNKQREEENPKTSKQ